MPYLENEKKPLLVGLMQGNFDLDRQAESDQQDFLDRVKDTIKKNLPGIIGNENIITSDGNKTVKVPIPNIELPHFRYGDNLSKHVGQGQGGTKRGDVIGSEPGAAGPGKGKGAGDSPGVDYFEADITIDDLAALVFADLGLPFLKNKPQKLIQSEKVKFDEIRKKGLMSNLDKRRTIKENLLRNARAGRALFGGITDDDLRFKTWERDVKEENNAVVLAMRDVSGSMGEFEKYITRSFYFWMVRFLRTKYDQVDIVFITHHTEAKEVNEDAFFNLGESGGTKVSSAYRLAVDIMKERYPSSLWNRYPVHLSDGDNWGEVDNTECINLVKTMLGVEGCSAFGYIEIQEGGRRSSTSTLMSTFESITDPHMIKTIITSKDDIYPALKSYFDPTKQEESK